MKKKFFAVAFATMMAVSTVMTASAEETLIGTEWWTGNQSGIGYVLADNSTISFDVDVTDDNNGYAAFSLEVRDNVVNATHCITSSSDGNCFYFEAGGTTGDAIQGINNVGSSVKKGQKYEVKVTRKGGDITIVYDHVDSTEGDFTYACYNTNLSGRVAVNFIAQVGTYVITPTSPEILESSEWWSGNGVGRPYSLEADSTKVFTMNVDSDNAGYAAFSVEVRDDIAGATHCITSSSDGNCGYFTDGGTTGDTITGVATTFDSKVKAGEIYEISITRSGSNIIIKYDNIGSETGDYTYVCNNTNIGGNVTVNFISQVGKYSILEGPVDSSEVNQDPSVYAQYKKVGNSYTVRVVAEVEMASIDQYAGAGFRCTKTAQATAAAEAQLSTVIFKSIMANGSKVEAADGKYFIVTEIQNVPADGKVYVRPSYSLRNSADVAQDFVEKEYTIDMAAIIQ